MKNVHARVALSLAALAMLITGVALYAGPLTPPAGPVTSTYKTLTDVEPRIAINLTNTPGDADVTPSLFKITQPGSYYLTGNITGVVGKHGIEIASSGVTLDLNGFDLAGTPGMGAFDGVSVTFGGTSDIAILNGSVRNWGDAGLDLGSFNSYNSRIEGVRASGNAGTGIFVGSGCTITNCSGYNNTGSGISIGSGGVIANCSASSNDLTGISTGNGSTLSTCAAFGNTGIGINAFNGGGVSNCSAYGNGASGIAVNNGSTVVDCTVRLNTLDGIVCGSACIIRCNTCASNGNGTGDGAGTHALGSDNRVEGNNCTAADRGIDVYGTGNVIIRSTCSGNTINWEIAADNICGPILDRTVPASAAISGNSAPDSTGSTHPNANFSY